MGLCLLPLGAAQPVPVKEAKKVLGGVVPQAVTSTVGGRVYLLALRGESREAPVKAYLLRKEPRGYLLVWTYPEGLGEAGLYHPLAGAPEELALLDLDRDGHPEAYLRVRECGSGGCTRTLYLHDHGAGKTWEISLWEPDYSPSPPPRPRLPQDLSKEALRRFLQGQLASLYPQNPRPEWEWWARHKAFSEGRVDRLPLRPKWYTPCPYDLSGRSSTVSARVRVRDLKLIALFKGPVVALNPATGACFVVYAPPSAYDGIGELRVLTPRKVVLIPQAGERPILFDPVGMLLFR